ARAVERDAMRTIELSRGGGPAVADRGPGAAARHGCDRPGARVDPPDAGVAAVRDEEVARAVERDATRTHELGRGGGPAVAAEPFGPGARHGCDRPGARVHPPDAVVFAVRDVDVARDVESDSRRQYELCIGDMYAVAAELERPVARHGHDCPRSRVHPPDAQV